MMEWKITLLNARGECCVLARDAIWCDKDVTQNETARCNMLEDNSYRHANVELRTLSIVPL